MILWKGYQFSRVASCYCYQACHRSARFASRGYSNKPALEHYSYGGRHTVTMIPGDGVYRELMAHVKEVFRYMGAPIDFEEVDMSSEGGMQALLQAVKRNGVALKGSVETDIESHETSKNVQLRRELALFANVVHCKTLPEVSTRHSDIDIVVIRENTEGEYAQLEHENVSGVVECLKIITRERSQRIAEFAFEYAKEFDRKKVTCIHKANIMKLGDGLFLQTCADVAKNFPEIEFNDMIVDNCSMQLVSRPQQFDIMVMPNLYGNIISNIAAGLVGGPGLVSGMNLGEKYAVFESGTRNTGSSIAGLNIANPVAVLLAAGDMLSHLGLNRYSQMLRSATYKTVVEDHIRTPDLGGTARTSEVVDAVIRNVQAQTHAWPAN